MGGASWTGDQDAFQGRNDDVVLNSATFNGGGGLNLGWTQDTGTNFRVRFVIQETAGGKLANGTFELWYSLNGGAYAEMTASTPVTYADTTQYTNGATTSQVIGAGTYVSGDSLAGVDNATDTGNVDYGGNDECEMEWCLTLDSGQLSTDNTIALRVYQSGGTALNTYTSTPTITVNVPAVPVIGTLSQTLANVTVTGSGAVDVDGVANVTLANVTLTSAGAVDVVGSAAITLANVTLTGAGTVGDPAVTGSLSQTLGNVTVTGSALVPVDGTLSQTLADVTLAGAGTITGEAVVVEQPTGRARRRRREGPSLAEIITIEDEEWFMIKSNPAKN